MLTERPIVRLWHKADIEFDAAHVRFRGVIADMARTCQLCPLMTLSGHLRSKI